MTPDQLALGVIRACNVCVRVNASCITLRWLHDEDNLHMGPAPLNTAAAAAGEPSANTCLQEQLISNDSHKP